MVNPLISLTIEASPIGSELDIFWELPATLPTNYKIYLFKKSGSAVPQPIIDGYFANIDDLTNFDYQGVFVFDKIKNETKVIADYVVVNGTHYYYSAVVRDETTPEESVAVSADATPDALIVSDILDGKDLVARAINKMFESIKDKNGVRQNLKKEIEVVKNFSTGPVDKDTIMVERVNGAEHQRFLGNLLHTYKNMIVLGSVDVDVIRVTFLTAGTPDRRDMISNLFRAKKFMLITQIKKYGAKDCSAVIEGDYYNPMFHGENVIGFTVVFSLLTMVQMKYEEEEITSHITQMEIQ
jgi:hypothetical protein